MDQQGQWQVAGNAAENYQRYLVPAIFGPWGETLIELARPQPGERVLDLACGPGVLARFAAARVGPTGRVIGLDLNPGMLAVARSLPPVAGAPIEWREGSALDLPLADAGLDLIVCQQSLQYFPDRATALREAHRVLRPGGRVALSVWRPIEWSPGFSALAAALARHVSAEAAQIARAPFALGDAAALQALLAGTGFGGIEVRAAEALVRFPSAEAFVQQYVSGSPLAPHVAQAGDDARAALVRDVAGALAPYRDEGGVAFPIAAHLALARA